MDNFAQFEKQLTKAYDQKVVNRFVEFHKTVALDALREVGADATAQGAFGSPIHTGRFRRSHNLTVGSPAGKNAPPLPGAAPWPRKVAKPYNAPSLSEARLKLDLELKPFGKVFITNSLPYSRRLEGGYSPKAPNGIYQVTAVRLTAKYRNFAGKILSGSGLSKP